MGHCGIGFFVSSRQFMVGVGVSTSWLPLEWTGFRSSIVVSLALVGVEDCLPILIHPKGVFEASCWLLALSIFSSCV